MADKSLYPIIQSKESELLLQSRVKEMLDKKLELEKELKHYAKIRKNWTRIDSTLKISAIILAISTSAAVSVVIPMAVTFIIPTTVAVASATSVLAIEGFVFRVSSRKKRLYRERCELIQSYLNKMFVYIEKCKDDSIITIEELEGFHRLMYEYTTDTNRLKSDYSKVEKQALSEAKKEMKIELKETFKEKEKNEIRSRYYAV